MNGGSFGQHIGVADLGTLTVWDGVTLDADSNKLSGSLPLHSKYSGCGVAGKFAGDGTLEIKYKTTPIDDNDYGIWRTIMAAGDKDSDTPFDIGLTPIPGSYIWFSVTETGKSDSITSLSLYLTQVGKGS